MVKVFIIAEAGINHNGKIKLAKQLIDIASKAKVDAVKFQLFDTDNFIHKKKLFKIYKIFKKLEFSKNTWKIIINYAKKKKIKLFFSVFDIPSVNLLSKLNIKLVKIPSGEINNIELLKTINRKKFKVILSTGMAKMSEIKFSLKILKNCNVSILHCVSAYPAEISKLNLNFIKKFRKIFNFRIGFSDHTNEINASSIAVSQGAQIIEKHFTYKKNQKFGDHKMSLSPKELIEFVKNIRNTEKMMGKEKKLIYKNELNLSKVARKGVYIRQNINKGEILKKENIILLRPENQKNLISYKKSIGKKAKKNIKSLDNFNNKNFK